MSKKKKERRKFNPIDKDKIAENPHLLPYAHTVGGVVIKPIDKGRVKGLSVTAMYEQTENQLNQIREQMHVLLEQAKAIHEKVRVSEIIYLADCGFQPVIGKQYHLYQKKNQNYVLSLVAPLEWGNHPPYKYIASMKLLADHTWEILETAPDVEF